MDSLPVSNKENTQNSRLFALVIGIDEYKDPNIRRLSGAVADAEAVYDFFHSHIHVPADRIIIMRNEQATKWAMISAFEKLASETRIVEKDPILIYYAGHGGQAEPPAQLKHSLGSKIEMLLPYDFNSKGSTTSEGQGLFDLKLSSLLANIARCKSDNITVILDCCHSGSGTRDTSSIRSIELPEDYTIPVDVLNTEKTKYVPPLKKRIAGESHVLLASCKSDQTSRESHGRGAFTAALLTLLKREGIDQFTYRGLIKALPDLPLQNPQCEGQNLDRMLFNCMLNIPRQTYSIIPIPQNPGKYTLSAGSVIGVTKGARFSVHVEGSASSSIGSVECTEAKPFSAVCSVSTGTDPFVLPKPAFAVQTLAGEGPDVCLFVEDEDLRRNLKDELRLLETTDHRSFRLVESTYEDPDLILKVCGSRIHFYITSKICLQHGLSRMPFEVPMDCKQLLSILSGVAHFYWNLYHSNREDGDPPVLSRKIDVQCLKLTQSNRYNDDFENILMPAVDPDGTTRNFNVDGQIFIDVSMEEGTPFGFKIINNWKVPLYAAMFYFDMSDLSIESYYQAGYAAKEMVEYSLPGQGVLNIGFGESGSGPRTFYLRENETVDVGFIKLYLTTQCVNFSGLDQKSPFAPTERAQKQVPKERKDMWDAIVIPVIQTKGTYGGELDNGHQCIKID